MARPTIAELRALVRSLRYDLSIHATGKLHDAKLANVDFESVVLTGSIVAHQCDRKTREVKWVIRGSTFDGQEAESVIKISPTGDIFVITVYCVD